LNIGTNSLLRKLFHFSGSVIPLSYLLTDKKTTLVLTVSFFIISCIVEFLRIKGYLKLELIEKYTKDVESRRPTGSFFFLLSSLITIILFREQIAIASLFILSISDPLSSLAGFRFGKKPFFGKTLEGTLAFFISSSLILLAFSFKIHAVIVGSLVATFTELFSSRFFDDNLSIPITTAIALTLLMF